MAWLEWTVVAILVAGSALYTVRRLLPKRSGKASAAGCHSCPAHANEFGPAKSPTEKTGELPR